MRLLLQSLWYGYETTATRAVVEAAIIISVERQWYTPCSNKTMLAVCWKISGWHVCVCTIQGKGNFMHKAHIHQCCALITLLSRLLVRRTLLYPVYCMFSLGASSPEVTLLWMTQGEVGGRTECTAECGAAQWGAPLWRISFCLFCYVPDYECLTPAWKAWCGFHNCHTVYVCYLYKPLIV